MLELTKTPRTNGTVSLTVVVPAGRADAVARAIEEAVADSVPAEEVFPGSTPGSILRGARGLREMTQAELAARVGVRASHISDMERGRRPIGKAMAKKLGEALEYPWKGLL
jgi:predicted transcriptional regulator